MHREHHRIHRNGWLRAAVLGANDGIVSTASLLVGVASAQASQNDIVIAGVAALVAGAMSMAAGEYVSVSSQADAEAADLAREKRELETNQLAEHKELTEIYIERGLEASLARQVAEQLMQHDALGAHARDELGISDMTRARPLLAAMSSALAFSMGALTPLVVAVFTEGRYLIPVVAVVSLLCLATLGGLAARVGGGKVMHAAFRVTFWGALAMGVTAVIGRLFGVML
ncbi:VIT1/CCC1 transporter family protein [Cellvibrio sp. ARAG 10.3]|uniref:VIT1/CCC1 transporter family protein n=1 Tax=Cellvibrio sp. ARAG 10.3 TaxID=3451358 RepID=UPI003F45773A